MSKTKEIKLTKLQKVVLGVVAATGRPATTSEVGQSPVGYSRAKNSLDALERKGMVARDYTSRSYCFGGYGWTVTPDGAKALEAGGVGGGEA